MTSTSAAVETLMCERSGSIASPEHEHTRHSDDRSDEMSAHVISIVQRPFSRSRDENEDIIKTPKKF